MSRKDLILRASFALFSSTWDDPTTIGERMLKTVIFCSVLSAAIPATSQAACAGSVQTVALSSGTKLLEKWEIDPAKIHRVRLPNGFELGLRIEPATAEKRAEILKMLNEKDNVDLVKISVFDMGAVGSTRLLTYTWGGANSRQGYGPRGGADRVNEIGEPGIVLDLKKQACSSGV